MTYLIRILILGSIVTLTACSMPRSPFAGRDRQYLSATSIPPLRIPPGVSSSAIHNEYPVSYHYYPPSSMEPSLVPPGLYS